MLRNNLNASSWKHIRTKLKQTVGHRVSACCQRPDTRLIRDLLTRHPVPSQAFRTPVCQCGNHSYSTSPSAKSQDNGGVCQSAGVPTLPPGFFHLLSQQHFAGPCLSGQQPGTEQMPVCFGPTADSSQGRETNSDGQVGASSGRGASSRRGSSHTQKGF